MRVAAGDEGERVDHRRVELDPVQAPREVRPSAMRRVPIVSPSPRAARSSAASTYSTSITRLDRDAGALGALRELAARRSRPAEARVVEDQRRLGEPLDRHRLAHALGVGREVQQLVVERRLDVEPAVVDREHDQGGLDLAVADGVGDLGGVLAEQAHAHVGVARAEVLHEVGEQVEGRVAEGAEGRRAGGQLAHLADGLAGLLRGGQRALRVRLEQAPRLGQLEPAAAADEQRRAELGLEPADLLRQARLGHVQG